MQTNRQPRVNIIVQTSPQLRDQIQALARHEGEAMSVIVRRLMTDAVRSYDFSRGAPCGADHELRRPNG